jgi:hypothetical protein
VPEHVNGLLTAKFPGVGILMAVGGTVLPKTHKFAQMLLTFHSNHRESTLPERKLA